MKMLNAKNIFLVDGIGAMITALIMAVILPALNEYIGMPLNTLYLLAIVGVVYAAYSFSVFLFGNHDNPVFLRIIMIANLLYCPLTLTFVGLHFQELTTWGVAYFLGEMPVILGIVFVEWKVYRAAFGFDTRR